MPALSGGTILYRRRSAKSVAWSRLNVIGVSAFFFLPALVAAFTRADEFHSVMNTGWPAALSHFASSASWVVFPDPSMPSTTNSFPGYSCGVVRLFSICYAFLLVSRPRARGAARHFESQRPMENPLQFRAVAVGRPQLEFRVAGGAKPDQVRVSTRDDVEPRHHLRVAAVES